MAELRAEHGLTQQQCADALGVAQNTYAEMETGRIRFRRRDLVTLAVLYGLPLEEAFPSFFGAGRAA
jgi:transcriptional regulator with XRE-family HTH domain